MAKRIKFTYSAKDKDNLVDYMVESTKDIVTQVEWNTVLNSVDPLVIDMTTVSNLYSCSVAATYPVHVELYNALSTYAVFDGATLIFSPASTVVASIENMSITSALDSIEVKVSIFGE